jgi:hypothetical protein
MPLCEGRGLSQMCSTDVGFQPVWTDEVQICGEMNWRLKSL